MWDGQRCGYRGRSLRSEDNRTAEAALPLEQGSGRLAGRGLAGAFPQGGSGLRLVVWGCVVAPGAGAGRRRYGKGQGGGFLSSERPGAELKAEREGVERGKDGSLTALEKE